LLFGARQILLHAFSVTDGDDGDNRLLLNPRFDFPPAFNFEPWWEDCPAIFRELTRLSAFLEEGDPLRPVALFYPLETIRAEAMAPACGKHFGWWAEALSREGIGYERSRRADARLGAGRCDALRDAGAAGGDDARLDCHGRDNRRICWKGRSTASGSNLTLGARA
jgi:hypothetical protein